MARKSVLAFAFGIALVLQSTAPTLADSQDSRVAAAQRLVDQTVTKNFVEQMSQSVWPTIEPGIRAKNPNIKAETLAKLRTRYGELMAAYLGVLMKDMVPVYAKYFTTEELNGLLAFQSTPLGKKALSVQPKIMGEAMPKIMQGVRSLMPKVQNDFSKILREQGIEL